MYKHLFLKTFHSFEHCNVSWWTGPGFEQISHKSNNNKWESEFKFWYLSFEIEQLSMVNCVIKDWISSQALMKSDVTSSYLLQLLIASWWFGFLMGSCKKGTKAEKSNQRFFEEVLLFLCRQLVSLSILVWIWKKVEPVDKL